MDSKLLPDSFQGTQYRLSDNWFSFVPMPDGPINYLEIGAFYGANLISVASSYGKQEGSQLYCIDPWTDYQDYPEYKTQQDHIYNTFWKNILSANLENKINVKRGFSNQEIPKLPDNFFDIIYIDGNHEPEYVLEDAVLSFRKLKVNGYLIFDDYGWGGPDLTTRGIHAFCSAYHKRIQVLGEHVCQLFIKKLR